MPSIAGHWLRLLWIFVIRWTDHGIEHPMNISWSQSNCVEIICVTNSRINDFSSPWIIYHINRFDFIWFVRKKHEWRNSFYYLNIKFHDSVYTSNTVQLQIAKRTLFFVIAFIPENLNQKPEILPQVFFFCNFAIIFDCFSLTDWVPRACIFVLHFVIIAIYTVQN